MDIKKISYLTLVEIIFFALIISSLFLMRYQTKSFMDELSQYSPNLALIQQDIQANNGTPTDYNNAFDTISKLEEITQKSLFITNVALPIFILIVFVLFQMLFWKIANQTKWKKIIIPALIQGVLILFTASLFLDWLSYALYGEGTSNAVWLIITFILLIVSTKFNFYFFAAKHSFFRQLKHSYQKHFFRMSAHMIIVLFFLLVLVFLATLVYVFGEIKISLWPPAVLLVVVSIFANLHKIYFIEKINE